MAKKKLTRIDLQQMKVEGELTRLEKLLKGWFAKVQPGGV
jgi:hypothetical protein